MSTNLPVRLVGGLAGLALAVSACGLGGAEQPARQQQQSSGPVKIVFQTLQLKPTFTDYIEKTVAAFEAANPDIDVEWMDIPFQGAQEKLVADTTAGKLPDVVNLNPSFAQPLEAKGVFTDLESAAPDAKPLYVQGAWDAFKVRGTTGSFGFPWYITSEVTMYNKKLFKKADLDPDKPPATLEALISAAEKIAKVGKGDFYGMHPALENRFHTDLAKLAVPMLDESGTWAFNTPAAIAHVERLTAMYETGVFAKDSLTQDHAKENEAYQAGKIALYPSGPNFLTIVKENAPDIAEATGVGPQITGSDGVANMSVMGLLVPKSSPNQAAAIKFATFMTNGENQLAFSKITTVLPSVSEALKDPYFSTSDGTPEAEARKLSAAAMQNAKNLTPVEYDDRVKKVVVGKVQLAMQGELTAKEALDQAVEEANQITGS
ncbi:sugar ABC transporter substrate-binding protein [Nonomuraea mesophila]|uniref:Sugar ABC transporter substrate-binding protein n=1 Tax=Nonomuraea mesophila TaxID=2530382 RepID=A0A4R5EWI4_9ACTN|nr:sugar ABC transporter substrate-binding protein [Nonomuraea mesophila]TDE39304.1 sugar ABC transporter substrate-binding protein [Nonomuraea mesophila]